MTKFEHDVQQLQRKIDAGEALIGIDAAKFIAVLIANREPARYVAERIWVNTWIEKDYEIMVRRKQREDPDSSS